MRRTPSQHDALALWSVVRRWMLRHKTEEADLEDMPEGPLHDLVQEIGGVMGWWCEGDGDEPLAVPGPPPSEGDGEPIFAAWRPGHAVRILPPHGQTFQAAQTIAPRARQGRLPFEPES